MMKLSVRFSAIGFVVLFALVVPVRLRAEDSLLRKTLGDLRQVKIIVEGLGLKGLGLNEEDLKDHLAVLLRDKLPKLRITESSGEFVYLNVNLDEMGAGGHESFYGNLSLDVHRFATMLATGQVDLVTVWRKESISSGPVKLAPAAVRQAMESLTARLATDWLQANP